MKRTRPTDFDGISLHAYARQNRSRLMRILLRRLVRRLSRALHPRQAAYPRAVARAGR
jgi:hypothetical protein